MTDDEPMANDHDQVGVKLDGKMSAKYRRVAAVWRAVPGVENDGDVLRCLVEMEYRRLFPVESVRDAIIVDDDAST